MTKIEVIGPEGNAPSGLLHIPDRVRKVSKIDQKVVKIVQKRVKNGQKPSKNVKIGLFSDFRLACSRG